MTEPNQQEDFEELQFASCPTEEAEPFYWRWTKEGKEVIKQFIKQREQKSFNKALEVVERMKKQYNHKKFCKESADDYCTCDVGARIATLNDVLSTLKNLKK